MLAQYHMQFSYLPLLLALLYLFPGDDEKKKRQERVRQNRHSISSVSSKTRESVEGSDKETPEPVSQPNNNAGIGLAPIVIVPTTAVTAVTSVDGSGTTESVPVMAACELNSETTNLLSMSKLARLGKDGLSSALPADLISIIQNSINASVTATLTADSPDLMRTLTTDEERTIQELVQVDIYDQPENTT